MRHAVKFERRSRSVARRSIGRTGGTVTCQDEKHGISFLNEHASASLSAGEFVDVGSEEIAQLFADLAKYPQCAYSRRVIKPDVWAADELDRILIRVAKLGNLRCPCVISHGTALPNSGCDGDGVAIRCYLVPID